MTYADKSRYDMIIHKVTHKGGASVMNFIKIFQNSHTLSVSVVNSYADDQIIHTFIDKYFWSINLSSLLNFAWWLAI